MANVGETFHPVSRDKRYRCTLTHTGHDRPHWVAYFCDEPIGSSAFRSSAAILAIGHHQVRNGALIITESI